MAVRPLRRSRPEQGGGRVKTVRYESTLDYYDGIQIFEARDAIGGHYLATLIDSDDSNDRYLVVGVDPASLQVFRDGYSDLREVLVHASAIGWCLAESDGDFGNPLELYIREGAIPDDLLPEAGFTLPKVDSGPEIVQAASERNRVVMELVAEPPAWTGPDRVRSETFGQLLIRTQNLLMHAYKRALRDVSSDFKTQLSVADGHLVDVVGAPQAGSLRVKLEAVAQPDLFGGGEIVRALNRCDTLFELVESPTDAKNQLQEHSGHLAGSYMKLMQFLAENELGMRYSWAEPMNRVCNGGSVSHVVARQMVDALSGEITLGQESLSLEGEFEIVNRGSGAWGLKTDSGVRTGKLQDNGPTLDGLEVGSRYRFDCVEELVLVESTGRESRTLSLIGIERI